jgi:hypothetical protein
MSAAVMAKLRWWMAPVAILTASAVAVVGILVYRPQLNLFRPAAPSAKAWNVDCGGGRSSDFKCFQTHYQIMVARKGVAAAFTDVKDADAKSAYVHGNCHQIAHVIGRAAGDRYGDVAKAYEQGDNFCASGYYHGVMEAVVGRIGYEQIRPKLNTICASAARARQYDLEHYNCVHGLGHGVMAVNNSELFDALDTCDSLTDSWERESCYGGVFMENVMDEINPEHHTKYLKRDDLVYPCNAVADPYKQQCFLMQTSHALQVTGYDFDRVFVMCDGVDGTFRGTCYQSLGRDASGNTVSDAVRTRDLCMKGRDHDAQQNCVIGAVKDFVWFYHSHEQGEKLCAILDPSLQETCLSTAKSFSLGTK